MGVDDSLLCSKSTAIYDCRLSSKSTAICDSRFGSKSTAVGDSRLGSKTVSLDDEENRFSRQTTAIFENEGDSSFSRQMTTISQDEVFNSRPHIRRQSTAASSASWEAPLEEEQGSYDSGHDGDCPEDTDRSDASRCAFMQLPELLEEVEVTVKNTFIELPDDDSAVGLRRVQSSPALSPSAESWSDEGEVHELSGPTP